MILRRIVLLLLLAGVATVYLLFDPGSTGWFPRCPFRSATGWLCPGCGSQRALHSLLNGEVASAFGYNALFVTAIPLVALLLYCEVRRTRCPHLYPRLHHPLVGWCAVAIVIAWWIGRNVL